MFSSLSTQHTGPLAFPAPDPKKFLKPLLFPHKVRATETGTLGIDLRGFH